jgi:nucleoside 2-deoxyribosyltransferase
MNHFLKVYGREGIDRDFSSLAKLSAFIREHNLRTGEMVSLINANDSADGLPGYVFTVDEALKAFPSSISERFDRILSNLDQRAPQLNNWIDLTFAIDYPLLYSQDDEEAWATIGMLENMRYVEVRKLDSQPRIEAASLKLRYPGWQRVDELKREPSANLKQGFIAMRFSDALLQARIHGLIAGIEKAGYEAKIIADQDNFNQDIDDEILTEIRKSRFVVADFTENSHNVYYEAGFAEALEKPVIYTCREDSVEETKFNIRQRNMLVWKEESIEDFCERLANRILRTVGLPTE